MTERKAPAWMEEPMLYRSTLSSSTLTYSTTTTWGTKISVPLGPNEIYGTAGNDYGLYGTSMDDAIYGLAGNDSLYGMGGNDILDGGTGTDVMAGGIGDDTYYLDNAGDVIWEWGGEGIDTVRATLSYATGYTLPTAVENLELIGTNPCGGYGNELDNVITGNDAYNALDGGAGNDTLYGGGDNDNLGGGAGNDILDGGTGRDFMQGGTGDDIYYVDEFDDLIIENFNAGNDTVRSRIGITLPDNVENLELAASSTNAYAYGNSSNNILRGNSTNNEMIGGGGYDTMFGGAGADTFKFVTVGDAAPLGYGFTDYIPDFSEAEGDKIDLSQIDANLFAAADQAFTFIGNGVAFTGVAGQLHFNTTFGFVEGDVNGDAVADFQIELDVAGVSASAFVL